MIIHGAGETRKRDQATTNTTIWISKKHGREREEYGYKAEIETSKIKEGNGFSHNEVANNRRKKCANIPEGKLMGKHNEL